MLTHWLSPAAYGQAALASTLISLIAALGLMGMDMSYSRNYLSSTKPNGWTVETFCWRFALVAAVAAGGVAGLVWLASSWNDPEALGSLGWWVFAGTALSLLMSMGQTRARLNGSYTRVSLSVAAGGIAATAVSVLLARGIMPDARALVIGYVVAYLLPVMIMGMPSWRQLASPSGLDRATRWDVFLTGLPGVVTAPMYWVLAASDRWVLQSHLDATSVGLYAIACTFGQLGLMVNSALLSTWLPEATRLHESVEANRDEQLATVMVRLTLLMLAVLLGIGILGGDILRLLTAGRFHEAAGLVPLLATGVFFYGCYFLSRTGLYLSRSLKWAAYLSLAVGVLSIGGNILLIPVLGITAAAVMQCVSFGLLAIIVLVVAQWKFPLPLPFARLAVGFALAGASLAIGQGLPEVVGIPELACKLAYIFVSFAVAAFVIDPGVARSVLQLSRQAGRQWVGRVDGR